MPRLDGSFLAVFLCEAFVGAERVKTLRPYIQRLAILLLACFWLVINLPMLAMFLR